MFAKKLIYTAVSMLAAFGNLQAQNEGYSVGTPQGSLSVSAMGAAVYSLNFEVPDGGPLTPQIGITYNSQMSGYGLAGYGMNIMGISCITRGGKDLFHNGEQKGVTYTGSDNLFLDGVRLIREEGVLIQNEARYSLEGDPYTKVYLHTKRDTVLVYVYEPATMDEKGRMTMAGYYKRKRAITASWFEVISKTGTVTQYGNTHDSRFVLRNDQGFPEKTIAWYINQVNDSHSNKIEYSYYDRERDSRSGNNGTPVYNDILVVRPKCIRYALNDRNGRGITNTIDFEYMSLGGNARPMSIAGRVGEMDVCLASVTTKTNNSVYRKYSFTYDSSSDQTPAKWTRLVNVSEENGDGESYPPVNISWNSLSGITFCCSQLDIGTDDPDTEMANADIYFSSADVNGDGISDVIQVSQTKESGKTKVYVNRSNRNPATNTISYDQLVYDLGECGSILVINNMLSGIQSIDYDGDGLLDIIVPINNFVEGDNGRVIFNVIYGKDIVAGIQGNCFARYLGPYQAASWEPPLIALFDIDGDGKDEIFCIERKKDYNNKYNAYYMEYSPSAQQNITTVSFTLDPLEGDLKWLFWGDYNSNGLPDLMFVGDSNYVINYNYGGNDQAYLRFSTGRTDFSGRSFKSYDKILQGDFNGDGLADFLCIDKGEDYFHIAYNQGDATFSTIVTESIGVSDQTDTDKDNEYFSISVLDLNNDGLSDVLVSKAVFRKHDHVFEKTYYRYDHSSIKWLIANGNGFTNVGSYETTEQDDTKPSSIFICDYDGDGCLEIANYGNSLIDNSSFSDTGINVYKTGFDLSQQGKIARITDGLGNISEIQYAPATDPSVYSRSENESSYPVNYYTLPLSVVKRVTSDNGSVQTTDYGYEDLMIHVRGRGMLGFNRTFSNNTTMGIEQTTEVTEWDNTHWLPRKVRSTSKAGTETSITNSEYTFAPILGTYFAYVSKSVATDLDGNLVTTITQYIDSIGVVKEQTVYNDDDQMYKKASYVDYVKKGGMYLPAKMIMEQKHHDYATPYSSTTSYVYDDLGQITRQTINDGTDLALSTEYTYDSWGNVISTKSLVAGDKEICSYKEYDPSGRFVTKSFTLPSSSVCTYNYDNWGNVLTETDETNASNPLTIQHRYDGWGREIETVDAAGIKTQYSIVWDSSNDRRYRTVENTDNAPSVTTWYDKAGRRVEQETLGQKSVRKAQTWRYNNQGQISQIDNYIGDLHLVAAYSYDDRGRVISETSSTGRTVTYAYGNRSLTATIGNRSYTKMSDAWGNTIQSVDPDGTTVFYTYNSNGQPREIRTVGSAVSMDYDAAGNRISLKDPDAGMMTYTYASDGTLLSQKDALNNETVNTYDDLGRIEESVTEDITICYEYGDSGNDIMRIKKQRLGGNTIEYAYDSLGRVKTEIRTVFNHGTFEFQYRYNDKDQLIETVYPGGLTVGYVYDANGFKTQTLANGQVVNELTSYDGKVSRSSFMNSLTTTRTLNDQGYLVSTDITAHTYDVIEQFSTDYDVMTGNLLSRQRTGDPEETFSYDNLDRLTQVVRSNEVIMSMNYAINGNISAKSDVGSYLYNPKSGKPHAVKSISNQPAPLPSSLLNTMYNAWGKIETISLNKYNGNALSMDIVYGPDQERWYSEYTAENGSVRETIYAGNYEKVTENGVTREFYYLDGNVIVVKQDGVFTPYLAFKDNLGSFLSIWDAEGEKVFDADYDVWGKQTVHLNEIGFQRGYTGHEMWNEFDIINMNGRLYDPTIARFLSPDNYVQAPDNSQNFNRYSYCLNNPLKYNDPSGEFWEWVIAGAIMGAIQSGAMAEMNEGKNFWSGAWKGAIVGAGSAAAGMGVGAAVSSALGSTGAITGFASGFAGGAVSGFASGTSSAWLNGSSFKSGLQSGLYSSAASAVMGGTIGGIHGGLDAYQHGGNFWTGRGYVQEYSAVNFDKVKMDYRDKITIGEGMEYSDVYAHKISKEEYPNIKIGTGTPNDVVVNHLYANDKMPLPRGYKYLNGYIRNTMTGDYALGCYDTATKNVFLSKCCFVSKENLVLVMGHEYYHAVLDQASYFRVVSNNIQHYYIEKWEYYQAKSWNYHPDYYLRGWKRYSVPPKQYDFCDYKYWSKYFIIK